MDASPNSYGTNDLWIAIDLTNDPVSSASEALLTLHGTATNVWTTTNIWQLLSKPDLRSPFWTPGQYVVNDAGAGQITFDPLLIGDTLAMFFRGVGGDTVVEITPDSSFPTPSSQMPQAAMTVKLRNSMWESTPNFPTT